MSGPENATDHPRVPDNEEGSSHRPGPATEAETGFQRKRMVQWLNPAQLAATAVRAMLSDVFGSYADRRELLAALNKPHVHDYSGPEHAGELWIDYTADLGDGFDSSYTIAWLLGREGLSLPMHNGKPKQDDPAPHQTSRGRILVLGGDQVYPTASREEYRDRMAGPFESALPCVDVNSGTGPHMLAIPGNHDWYDGLTAFIRLFCQGRWIGGWETQQSRSYWAAKLPHGWWLLGTDIQLHADVDGPQLDYFRHVASQMKEGDRVVLCTAEPSWVHTPGVDTAFDNLAYFERSVLGPAGAHLALTLTGDLHHFAHYVNEEAPKNAADAAASAKVERHKITAGGGGAYLLGTQTQPAELNLRESKTGPTHKWKRKALFPTLDESYALRWRAPIGVLTTPVFCAILGVVYALYAWFLENTSLRLTSPHDYDRGPDWMIRASGGSFGGRLADSMLDAAWLVGRTPGLLLFSLVIILAMVAFATPDDVTKKHRKYVAGITHGALHVVAAVLLAYVLTRALAPANVDANIAAQLAAANATTADGVPAVGGAGKDLAGYPYLNAMGVLLLMVPLGGLVGGIIFGLFLLPGVNLNEAFSSQALAGYKNFIRMRLDAQGNLTVYPVGLEKPASWKFRPNAPEGQPWYEPDGDPPRPHLIEQPFTIPGPPRGVRLDRIVSHEGAEPVAKG